LAKIDVSRYKQIKISNVFFIYTYGDVLSKKLEGYKYDAVLFDDTRRDWMEEQHSIALRNIYSNLLEETTADNKIYISRYKESKEVSKLINAVKTYKETKNLPGNINLAREVLHIENGPPEGLNEFKVKVSRAFTPEDELLLESYFSEKGYKVISPGDYSVEEQIKIFTSSSVIAGAGGSGLTNLLFCNSDTKVILLTAGNLFGYGGHNRSALANKKQVKFFPERIHYNPRTTSTYLKF
jgi:capsular polysaccharide biosynthesis protein